MLELKNIAYPGTSLGVLWFRLHTSTAGAMGSVPGELRSHMLHCIAKKLKKNFKKKKENGARNVDGQQRDSARNPY